MRLRYVWLGLSLFISSGLVALLVTMIVGEGASLFGVVFGINLIQDLFVFLGGGSMAYGLMAKPKPKVSR
ncbi:MAG: hypothetical protein FWD92_04005 [Methanomassiliicoccaceae archaeon]|nr:hypothetical protein [Methanomassiliicoccaceae archaeon]